MTSRTLSPKAGEPVCGALALSESGIQRTLRHEATHVTLNPKGLREGEGDLVSGLITEITRLTFWLLGLIYLLTKSP